MIVQEKIVESKHQKKQIAEVFTFDEFPLHFWRTMIFYGEKMAVLQGEKNQIAEKSKI